MKDEISLLLIMQADSVAADSGNHPPDVLTLNKHLVADLVDALHDRCLPSSHHNYKLNNPLACCVLMYDSFPSVKNLCFPSWKAILVLYRDCFV